MRRFFRKLRDQVVALLVQGVTPHKIALAIAVAIALGVFPVLGSTTLLCAGAAAVLGLNLPVMQLVNWLTYPLQLALLVPLLTIGSRVFGLGVIPPLSELLKRLTDDLWGTIVAFWPAAVGAILAWLVLAPIAAAVIYFALLPILQRLGRRVAHT